MIDIERGRITLPRYLFPTNRTRVLDRNDIVEIIDWFPPAIVTSSRELLLVTRLDVDALKAFAHKHEIPFTQRYDVWGDLLEPFLDTEFSPEVQIATRKRLGERGLLTDSEIDAIRARVEKRMIKLTVLSWEWQRYGLSDVLIAMKPKFVFGRKGWEEFYSQAMEISLRGKVDCGMTTMS